MLYEESGLKGLSGISYDLGVLESLQSASATDAIEYFVGRIRMGIDGLDALIFTGGIGKNSNRIRAATLAGMDWLGTALDKTAN